MAQELEKLLSISSEPIVRKIPDLTKLDCFRGISRHLLIELEQLLGRRNGFWTYESSLLVRPLSHPAAPLGLLEWNEHKKWKGSYVDDLDQVLCFAEDVFGCQYCIRNDKVSFFDPETAQFEDLATSLDEWARLLMDDYKNCPSWWRGGNRDNQQSQKVM